MSVFPTFIYKFNMIPTKTSAGFLLWIEIVK